MNATDFSAGDRIALFMDLRSMRDNDLHGSGLRLGMLNVTSSSSQMLSSSLSPESLKA